MIQWREATVERLQAQWPGAAEYDVTLRGPTSETIQALAYTDLVGQPQPGDRVLLNVAALERELGTGGMALIVAVPDRLPADPQPGPGHIVKARYTPLQTMVLGVDEQESPHHEVLAGATGINAMPVIMADLHSAVPAILAGLREAVPEVRAAYVMTDGGALPIAFSRTVAGLREAGWLAGTVTVGQSFGGDLEAVNVHTGLLAAAHVLHADLAIVAQGRGKPGHRLPVGSTPAWRPARRSTPPRCSVGGPSPHYVSRKPTNANAIAASLHHNLTAYDRVAMAAADLPVPLLGGEFGDRVLEQARDLAAGSAGRLMLREVDVAGFDALTDSPVPPVNDGSWSRPGPGLFRDRCGGRPFRRNTAQKSVDQVDHEDQRLAGLEWLHQRRGRHRQDPRGWSAATRRRPSSRRCQHPSP